MSTKTQGTWLFTKLPDSEEVIRIKCVTGLNYSGGNRATKPNVCLDDDDAINEPGDLEAGTLSPAININPKDAGHVALWNFHQQKEGSNLHWVVGLSDGTDSPTVAADGSFELPATRTWMPYYGFIQTFPFDAQARSDYTSSITILLSGTTPIVPKTTPDPNP